MLFSLIKKCVFAFLVFFICLPPIILSQNISETTRLVVTFESAEANAKIKPINVTQRLPCRVIKQYGRRLVLDMQRIVMDLEAEKRKIQSLFDAIELVELDYLISTQASPWINPESQTPLWNLLDSELHSVHAEGIWNTTHGNPNEVVAVIDSGIAEVAKPMFLHLLDGYDFVSDARISMDGDGRDADATDPGDQSQTCPISSWHGTKVASVIAGRHDNPWGMKGIAQNCSILPLRVLGQCRMGYATDVSDALVWAIGGPIHGIPSNPKRSKTITLSLAGRGRCPNYLQSAVDYALRLGAAVIAAAGNYNESFSEYFPGNCEGVIAVAASTREGELASYSNWGTRLQAPGGDLHNAIMSLGVNPWGTAVEVSFEFGTSFAAPHVSSMVVLGNSLQNYSYMSENDSYVDVVFDRNATSDFSSNISSNLSVFDSVYAQSLPTFTNNRPGFQVYTNHNNLRFAYGSINFDQIALQEGGFYFICDRGHFICDITLEVQKERKLDGTGYWPFRNLEKYHVYCCNMKFDTTKFGDKTHARLFANAHLDSRATETLYYKKIFLRGFQFGVDSIYLTTHQSGDIEISRYWWWEPWRPNNYWADDSKCDKHGPEYIVVGFHGIIGENFFHSSRVICAELFVPVPIGFYSNGPVADANGGAIACPKGTFSSAIGSAGCTSCSSGFYASNTGSSRCIACTTCHTGSYPKNCGLQSAGACTVCSAGSFSPASTTTCTRCSAGTFSSASSVSCSNCLAGKFSAASASVCSDCEGGKFSAAQSSSSCDVCPANMFSLASSTACTLCHPGTASSSGVSVCSACPNTPPANARFTRLCEWRCNVGYYNATPSACTLCTSNVSCAAGLFRAQCTDGIQNSPGNCTSVCTTLPSNAVFVSYNELNRETGCWWGCNRGFYRSSVLTTATCISSTITCSHGFYPTSASYNGITHTTTAPSCAACAPTIPNADFSGAGNPNVENSCPYTCKDGFFKLTESGPCNRWTQKCTAGFFWTAGTKTSDATCTECSPNYAASANPEHYVYDFMTCSYKCSAGYGINAAMSSQCTQCAAGKYQNPQASTSNSECTVCDSNSFQNSPGSAECIAVPANGQKNDDGSDYICNKGYFRVDGIAGASIGSCSLCATCASGNYWSVACNGTTAGTCSSCSLIGCPDTFYRSRCSGYNLGSCIQCSNCTSGSFFGSCNGNSLADDRTCSPCPMGQAGGGGFAKACTACGEGSFSSAQGATACAACSSISPTCSDTFFRSGCGGSSPGTCTRCRDCNSGSFFGSCSGSSLLDDRTCTLCPAGQAGGGGFAKTCTACGAGSYSSAAGAHECFSCSSIGCPDTYYRSGCGGSLLGSCLQCSTCSSGSFFGSCSGTSLSDDRTCTACPAGKAGAGTFSKACTDCIAGTFSPGSGAALCTTCSPGKFSAAAAAVACADCSPIPALGQFTNLCAWKCHLGHFKDSVSSCSLCSSNTSCNAGLFKAACIDGISDTNCSLPCSTKSQQASSQYTLFFVGSTDTYCWWGCNRGFYKNVASAQCVSSSTVCNAGFYPSSPTFNSFTTLTTAPSCEPCFPSIQHANFSGGGNPNNASSCPYRCNHGYFNLHPWGSCSLWTSNCPAGFFWTGGTATADATCTECSPNHVRASSTDRSFYVYSPNVCTFKCIPGYGKRAELNDQCRACPAGMYHNSSVLNSICQLCGAMEYQKSVGMDQCVAVPPFGQAIANRSDFTCNHGYVYQAPSVLSIIETCALCQNNNVVLKGATSQIKDIVWRSGGQCVVESFSCNEGFYRNWTQHDCMACPSEAPANALKLSSTSGICPLCNGVTHAAERDRNAYCPFQCNSGFYSSPSFNYSCIRCSVPVCSLGLFSQLCVLNQTVDQCQTCSHVLQASQNWVVSGTTCQWHCRAGFFLNMSARPLCQMCAPGRIKPLEGNHSCSDCPVGSFSASSISCQFCNPGRYSNATASTVCQQCEMGTFSPSVNRTSCISCVSLRTYPSSRTLVTGSSLCVLCPALFPLSQDGVMCGLPLAPCPTGFYLPQLALNNTLCALCPVGTYCDDAQGTLIPKPCPFGRPFSFLPSVSIDNCSSTNFLTDERWRTTC